MSAKTKSEALAKLKALRAAGDAGLPIAPGNLTVSALLTDWFAKGLSSRRLQEQSIATHRWAVSVLSEELGTRRVRSLSPEQVEAALERRSAAGLSRASLAKLRTTLGMALSWAERRGQVARNVARVAELPASARPAAPGRSMTAKQARAFLAAAEESPHGALWTTMLYLGLRPGEAAALAWDDVDLPHRVVHVRRALKRSEAGRISVGPTKTAQSVRSLDAPPVVVDHLRRRRHEQRKQRLAAGSLWSSPDDLIFTTGVGSPLDPTRLRAAFTSVAQAAGIGHGWSPNSLRHTAASLMSDAGVPLERIADQLGHRDTRMASLHYRHRVRPTIAAATVLTDLLRQASK
ncbi:MAG: tyrosine-type recombinase/integrase [Ilumatobacteraceae bacterium]